MASLVGKDSGAAVYQTIKKATSALRNQNKLETISEERIAKGQSGLYKTVRPTHISVDKE